MSIGNHVLKFIDFEIREGDSSFIHLKLVFTYGLRFVSGGFFRNDISFLWRGEEVAIRPYRQGILPILANRHFFPYLYDLKECHSE